MERADEKMVRGTDPPRVTIMIPTYNQAHLVLDAVDSALAQDYPNLEVIVSDDASTDATPEVMASRSDPRLRYWRNSGNLGRVANYRNALYCLASGDWVVNLDGDDYFIDEKFVSCAVSMALSDPQVLLVAARVRVTGGLSARTAPCPRLGPVLLGWQALYRFVSHEYPLFHMAALYRRREALALSFYGTDTLSADMESMWRLAVRGKVACLDRVVGVWRVSDASVSCREGHEARLRDLEVWPRVLAEAVRCGMPKELAIVAERRAVVMWAYADLSRLAMSADWRGLYRLAIEVVRRTDVSTGLFLATRWRLYARVIRGLLR